MPKRVFAIVMELMKPDISQDEVTIYCYEVHMFLSMLFYLEI